jgi:hypothetical protein
LSHLTNRYGLQLAKWGSGLYQEISSSEKTSTILKDPKAAIIQRRDQISSMVEAKGHALQAIKQALRYYHPGNLNLSPISKH